jgi:hypothetical protein
MPRGECVWSGPRCPPPEASRPRAGFREAIAARDLLVMSDTTSALLDILHSGQRLDPDELRDLYASYGCKLLGQLLRALSGRAHKVVEGRRLVDQRCRGHLRPPARLLVDFRPHRPGEMGGNRPTASPDAARLHDCPAWATTPTNLRIRPLSTLRRAGGVPLATMA